MKEHILFPKLGPVNWLKLHSFMCFLKSTNSASGQSYFCKLDKSFTFADHSCRKGYMTEHYPKSTHRLCSVPLFSADKISPGVSQIWVGGTGKFFEACLSWDLAL